MKRIGKLSVRTVHNYGGESETIFDVIEIEINGHKLVGQCQFSENPKSMQFHYDFDLNNKEELDRAFNNMGTNTYTWIQSMTKVLDSLDDTYPIGTIYTTVNPNFNPNIEFGGTWSKYDESNKIDWLRTA